MRPDTPPNTPESQIPRWSAAYARHRTLPVLVSLGIHLSVFAAIYLGSLCSGRAFREGHTVIGALWGALALAGGVATIWVAIPSRGGRWIQEFGERLYGDEGRARAVVSAPGFSPRILAVLFGLGVLTLVILGLLDVISVKWYQPVSALFCVPFLLVIKQSMRASLVWIDLWAGLYALHAILVAVGLPIVFHDPLESLNLVLPIFGYGVFAAFVGHLYGRFALRKLRDACRGDEE